MTTEMSTHGRPSSRLLIGTASRIQTGSLMITPGVDMKTPSSSTQHGKAQAWPRGHSTGRLKSRWSSQHGRSEAQHWPCSSGRLQSRRLRQRTVGGLIGSMVLPNSSTQLP